MTAGTLIPDSLNSVAADAVTELMAAAERELSAFQASVRLLYGAGEAQTAAEDWLRALENSAWLESGYAPNWRALTTAAAHRLGRRIIPTRPEYEYPGAALLEPVGA